MIAGGVLGMIWLRLTAGPDQAAASGALLLDPPEPSVLALAIGTASATAGVSLSALGLFFLKVGAVLYGSGYVLVAFLEGGLVDERGWLSQGQLMDAIAMGQLTPGPVLASATFIGYLIAGVPGAVVATAGSFFRRLLSF